MEKLLIMYLVVHPTIRKAMYTVEKDYSVVGVLEMFNTSLGKVWKGS